MSRRWCFGCSERLTIQVSQWRSVLIYSHTSFIILFSFLHYAFRYLILHFLLIFLGLMNDINHFKPYLFVEIFLYLQVHGWTIYCIYVNTILHNIQESFIWDILYRIGSYFMYMFYVLLYEIFLRSSCKQVTERVFFSPKGEGNMLCCKQQTSQFFHKIQIFQKIINNEYKI